MSAAKKGKRMSDGSKLKMSAAKKGKRMSDETKLKISAAQKGKKDSDETKLKIRAAMCRQTIIGRTSVLKNTARKKQKNHNKATCNI